MSSKLPILLAIAGVAYFISTASAETGDDISGCMEVTACNYDSTATIDDGSCYGVIGCIDSLATNYDPVACIDDGSCTYSSVCTEDSPTGL